MVNIMWKKFWKSCLTDMLFLFNRVVFTDGSLNNERLWLVGYFYEYCCCRVRGWGLPETNQSQKRKRNVLYLRNRGECYVYLQLFLTVRSHCTHTPVSCCAVAVSVCALVLQEPAGGRCFMSGQAERGWDILFCHSLLCLLRERSSSCWFSIHETFHILLLLINYPVGKRFRIIARREYAWYVRFCCE